MKKLNVFLFYLCILFYTPLSAQVSIGTGTLVNQSIPIELYYEYTYSQSIYPASEINASGSITGITYYVNSSTTLANSSDWTVYIGHTSKSSFASTSDWDPVASLTQVFSGAPTISGGVVTLTFSTPFTYNGRDNLIIAVDENMPGYDGSSHEFYCTATTGNQSITYYSDNTNPDPTLPPTASYIQTSLPNIELQGITVTCPRPTALAVSNVSVTTATITWGAGNTTPQNWEVAIVPQGTPATGGTSVTDTFYNATGLTANTTYEVYVREICTPGDTSTWLGPVRFATPCVAITAPYSENFDNIVLVERPFTSPPALPDCWENPQAGPDFWSATDETTNDAQYLHDIGDHTTGSGNYMWIDASGNINDNEMISPSIDISSLTSPMVGFWFASNNTNNSVNHTISLDVWDGSSWVNIASESGNFPGWTEVSGLIPTGIPSTTKFRIEALADSTGTSGTYYYNDLGVDDFYVIEAPSCTRPSNLSVSNVGDTTATITWGAGNTTPQNWEVAIVPQDTPATGGTSVTDTFYNATGLMGNTAYEVYVREICTPGDTSTWLGPVSFNTPCGFTPGDSAAIAIPLTGALPIVVRGATDSCYTNQSSLNSNAAPDIWYTYVLDSCANSLTVSLCGSTFDTRLYIVTDDTTFANDDYCGTQSQLNLEVNGTTLSGGDTVYIIVDGYGSAAGDFVLTVNQSLPGDSDANAIPLTGALPIVVRGATDSCYTNQSSLDSNAAPDIWYTYVLNSCADSLTVSLCGSTFDTRLYIVTDDTIFANDDYCGTQSQLDLEVNGTTLSGGDTVHIIVDGHSSATGDFVLTVNESGLPPGDSDANAIPLTGALPIVVRGTTDSCYTNQSSLNSNVAPDIWYTHVLNSCADSLNVSLCGSTFDTRLYIVTGDTIFDDDDYCGTQSQLNLEVDGTTLSVGDTVYIIIDGYYDETGDFVLTVDETIQNAVVAAISYADTTLCADSSTYVATINATTGGSFSSPTLTSVNTTTGAFTTDITSVGSHAIYYSVSSSSTCSDTDTAFVTIHALEDASFDYDTTSYCIDSASTVPTITGATGGTFSEVSGTAGIVFNTTTGAIDLGNSTAGTYTVQYLTAGTCPNSTTTTIAIKECDVNVEVIEALDQYSVFPNPNQGTFTILNEGEGKTTAIRILDVLGRTVYAKQTYMNAKANLTIDLQDVATGAYFVNIKSAQQTVTYQITVRRDY